MWRLLIGKGDGAACVKFAPGFAFHQHRKAACGNSQFGFLPCNNIRQIFDCPGQMCDLFFKLGNISHRLHLGDFGTFEKGGMIAKVFGLINQGCEVSGEAMCQVIKAVNRKVKWLYNIDPVGCAKDIQ